jgi:metallophosphoesterase (TIGR00282 family)
MKILFLGDIIGRTGRNIIRRELSELTNYYHCDVVAGNVENLADGFGMTEALYEELEYIGVHIMTSGNHIWDRREILDCIDRLPNLIRPANYPEKVPGTGLKILEYKGIKIAFINLMGRVFMPLVNCPFKSFDNLYENLREHCIIVDFHGEATSEKNAFCHYVDGRAAAVIGTHTHVQTNDDRLFTKGTYFISDVGMCGALDSVIGMEKDTSIGKFLTAMPAKFTVEKSGRKIINAILLDIDNIKGKIRSFLKIKKIYDK